MIRRSSRLRKRLLSSDDTVKGQKLRCDPERSSKHPDRDTDSSLCEGCELLCYDIRTKDFSKVKESGMVIGGDLTYPNIESCQMCRFMSYSIQSYHQERDAIFQLRLFSSRRSFSWLYRDHAKYLDTVGMLAVVPEHLFVEGKEVKEIIRKHVPEFMVPAYPGHSLSCISAKKIDASRIDFTFVNNCLSYCNANHHCREASRSARGKITLYDYRKQERVRKPAFTRYLALSYVWGPETDDSHSRHGSTPKVVEDVIKIAKQLEIDYIWVDNYCIEQHDPHKIQQELSSMYAIYKNAYLTVVDGAGSNKENGLFGVSRPRTGCQSTIQLAEQQWISTLRNPQSLIEDSPWITRGWTYQEAIASSRLLIFTEEQVYFECEVVRCWESIHFPLETHHQKNKSRLQERLYEPIFCQFTRNATAFEGRGNISRYINQYTQRTLTNSHDALNAIAGVLSLLEIDNGRQVYNFWGVPLLAPDPKYSSSALVTGMAWMFQARGSPGSRETIERRNNFPSWTWAGWQGVVQSFELGYFNHTDQRIALRIQSGKNSQEAIAWSHYWDAKGGMEMDRRIDLWGSGLGPGSHRREPYNYPWLEVTTMIIKVDLIYLSLSNVRDLRKRDLISPEWVSEGFGIIPPDGGWPVTRIDFPDYHPELIIETVDGICCRKWECMVVGYTPEKEYTGSDCPFVILLKYNKCVEGYERMWGGRLQWPDGWEEICDHRKGCIRLY
ncbi:HET-domain-containing protein [Aspergillus crustosus]